MTGRSTLLLSSAFLVLSVAAALGQDKGQKPAIDWRPGPTTAPLGDSAEIVVPEGFLFTDKKGTQKLLELTQNIPSGTEVGAVIPAKKHDENIWFVTFEYHEVGFVSDDEKDKLDADALLTSIKNGTEDGNKIRAEKGWIGFHVVGWEHPPFYDERTHNLTWAILGRDDKGIESVNHSVRVLGRLGTMDIDLVLNPDQYAQVLPQFDQLIAGLTYRQGHRYADHISGDKVAGYGLTALIAGGAGALAVKTGILLKMWKLLVALFASAWKLIVAVFVAVGAWLKKMFNKISGRKKDQELAAPSDASTASGDSQDPKGDSDSLTNASGAGGSD